MTHPHPVTAHQEQNVDDLTRIHGIGQAMEHKLNEVGVFSFAQLADMSSENLAAVFSHVPGWSAEREKDLISQARHFVKKEDRADNPVADDNAQYLAQFSVDLLLDNQKRVRRTHIIHIQSGTPGSWADWDRDRLAEFILRNAISKPAQVRTETTTKKTTLKSLPEDEQQTTMREIVGDLNISGVEIRTKSGAITHWLAKGDEPFAVSLTLDMSKTSISADTPLQCQTEVYIKNLTDGKRHIVGENNETITSKNLLPLTINCNALPQGSYRLEAYVTLSPNLENSNPRTRLIAMTESKVFRVN